jgi:hypothetical protein
MIFQKKNLGGRWVGDYWPWGENFIFNSSWILFYFFNHGQWDWKTNSFVDHLSIHCGYILIIFYDISIIFGGGGITDRELKISFSILHGFYFILFNHGQWDWKTNSFVDHLSIHCGYNFDSFLWYFIFLWITDHELKFDSNIFRDMNAYDWTINFISTLSDKFNTFK